MFNRVICVLVAFGVASGCNCGSAPSMPDAGGAGGREGSGGMGGSTPPADAGIPDAGLTDAGARDAGVDAGTVDAGPPCGIPLDETTNATLYMSIDDEGTLYINGQFIAEQMVPWSTPLVRTIRINRNPTVPNVVAIEARNRFSQPSVDRAALVDFRLGDAGDMNAPQIFASGSGWKTLLAADAGISLDAGWAQVGFDDSAWPRAVEVLPYGSSPYGNIFSQFGINASNAKWMWAYDPASTPIRPDVEPIFFRHVFFFSADGGFSSDAGQCSR
jgi:hypothetical protein